MPLFLTFIIFASLSWAAFGRPEFGDLRSRWQSLLELVSTDRLAYSFLVDLLVFWLFQSWLVPDDMARRNWHNGTILWVVRLVPLVGLVV